MADAAHRGALIDVDPGPALVLGRGERLPAGISLRHLSGGILDGRRDPEARVPASAPLALVVGHRVDPSRAPAGGHLAKGERGWLWSRSPWVRVWRWHARGGDASILSGRTEGIRWTLGAAEPGGREELLTRARDLPREGHTAVLLDCGAERDRPSAGTLDTLLGWSLHGFRQYRTVGRPLPGDARLQLALDAKVEVRPRRLAGAWSPFEAFALDGEVTAPKAIAHLDPDDHWNLFEFISRIALRIDGYALQEGIGLPDADTLEDRLPYYSGKTHVALPARRKLIVLFHLQRFLGKWGGEGCEGFSHFHRALRQLALELHDEPVDGLPTYPPGTFGFSRLPEAESRAWLRHLKAVHHSTLYEVPSLRETAALRTSIRNLRAGGGWA